MNTTRYKTYNIEYVNGEYMAVREWKAHKNSAYPSPPQVTFNNELSKLKEMIDLYLREQSEYIDIKNR